MNEAVLQWFRDLTVGSGAFTVPELASAEAPRTNLHQVQAGMKPLTVARLLAMIRVALRQDPSAMVAALGRLLALANTRLVVSLAPDARFAKDLRTEAIEVDLAAAAALRWAQDALRDGALTPEERAEGRACLQAVARQVVEAETVLEAQQTPQLALIAGGAR